MRYRHLSESTDMTSDSQNVTRDRAPLNAWLVLLAALTIAFLLWGIWIWFGAALVHERMANRVAERIATQETNAQLDKRVAAEARSARFAELGQSGDAFGSLNTLLTAMAGALVFWAGFMQHRALKHAQEVALEEREARQQQANDMRTTIRMSEESNRLARESYVVEQRAWVKVEVAAGGPLYYDKFGAHLTLNVSLTNLGKTPALHATARCLLELSTARGLYDTVFFDEAKHQDWPDPLGLTIFPGETAIVACLTAVGRRDINRAGRKADPELDLQVPCIVTYRVMQEIDVVRRTGHIYAMQRTDVDRTDRTKEGRMKTAIYEDDLDIAQGDLILWRRGATIVD